MRASRASQMMMVVPNRVGRLWDARPRLLVWIILLAAAAAIPALSNGYVVTVLTLAGLYVLLAIGMDLEIGHAGLLDLGYVAFYGIGAYLTAILAVNTGLSFFILLPLSAAVAAIPGIGLGVIVLKMRPDYLALVTLGFGELAGIAINNLDRLTGGPNGIVGIPAPIIFGFSLTDPVDYYFLVVALIALGIFVSRRLTHSHLGIAWSSIRDDEIAAISSGMNVVPAKLWAWGIGAAFAGLAGSVFAVFQTAVSPESFTIWESILVIVIVIVGGRGSLPGIGLGVGLMIVLPEFLRPFANYRLLVFSVVLVATMVLRPSGLWPQRSRHW
jgi:branched-chain amino acid transport system permease protein